MSDGQIWLGVTVCIIVAAHAYSMGRYSGREKGREEGIEAGKEQMLAWMRSEGMKRRRPRVKVTSLDEDEQN
jgi:hypothetical protein